MGMFINLVIRKDYATANDCIKCADVCPVNIFAKQDGKLVVVEENTDECTLCGLCTDLCPDGIIIEKNY